MQAPVGDGRFSVGREHSCVTPRREEYDAPAAHILEWLKPLGMG